MKTLEIFEHINAKSFEDAVAALQKGNAEVVAGGTDLIGTRRFNVLPSNPATLINLKTIPNADYIKEEGGFLKIGALAKLEDIAESDIVKNKYAALAEAAHKTASPHLREMGTIGGNICQLNRCWFFRKDDNYYDCLRKGNTKTCFALTSDNRYHSIFGMEKMCAAVNPSDTAPALVALDASIVTTKRTIKAEEFWAVAIPGSTVLDSDEIVKEIQIPTPASGSKSAFKKLAIRESIDFPIVNCAVLITSSGARICMNAVHNKPRRATDAEALISGKTITEELATQAGEKAVEKAVAMSNNKWKIAATAGIVKETILAAANA